MDDCAPEDCVFLNEFNCDCNVATLFCRRALASASCCICAAYCAVASRSGFVELDVPDKALPTDAASAFTSCSIDSRPFFTCSICDVRPLRPLLKSSANKSLKLIGLSII